MPKTNQRAEILLEQIAAGRKKLQTLWDVRGYTDSIVLAASIELDQLLNEYQKLPRGGK